ncbi:hypothetical protein SAMN06265222_1077 [Neorhodopirellula lusitana]|uniref:Uncharacterized protein n=1 Tax=Neorhodopirellula lusitana TaxID=445327 RepID=A0ABY1Q8J3_9BACT|nr:hypothetical protein SAMN06265222_1077 [Neorhodopirellula lusitana]
MPKRALLHQNERRRPGGSSHQWLIKTVIAALVLIAVAIPAAMVLAAFLLFSKLPH